MVSLSLSSACSLLLYANFSRANVLLASAPVNGKATKDRTITARLQEPAFWQSIGTEKEVQDGKYMGVKYNDIMKYSLTKNKNHLKCHVVYRSRFGRLRLHYVISTHEICQMHFNFFQFAPSILIMILLRIDDRQKERTPPLGSCSFVARKNINLAKW